MMSHEVLVGPMRRGDEHAVDRTMPQHATTIRAFRQPAGGTAQLAGTSTTNHSRRAGIAAGPLTPGVTYEFWIVGVNAEGEGPESNHVTHAVPVTP